MLKSIDDGVGMIVDILKEKDIYDDTIIIFTSDNGGEDRVTQNGHLRAGKSTCYEGGLRIPLVIAWGDKIQHQVCSLPTINLDMAP